MLGFVLAAAISSINQGTQFDWRLTFEKSNFLRTGRYEESLNFCRQLARVSDKCTVYEIGVSPENRPMVVVVLSNDTDALNPNGRTKPLLFIENGIHSGEIEGKDATLILARRIIRPAGAPQEPDLSSLLDKVNIAFIPVFSVDAHERMSPYNRANQNGPIEMGWRATSENFNLNRDFTKADAVEMQNLLPFLSKVKPDFFIDNHTTDGGDWQYTVQYDVPIYPTMASQTAAISKQYVDSVIPKVEQDGFLCAPYFGGFDDRRPDRGITLSSFGPRYSTGYQAVRNRPSLLVETHVLKPYAPRVWGTYSANLRTIEWMGQNAEALLTANAEADADASAMKEGDELALTARNTGKSRPYVFKGFKFEPYKSDISGNEIPHWTTEKVDHQTVIRDELEAAMVVKLPAGYLVPGYLWPVIQRLKWHGIQCDPVNEQMVGKTVRMKVQMFTDIKLGASTFEGRLMPQFQLIEVERDIPISAGSVVVPIGQPLARLAANLLETSAPDGFASWGFFNGYFESKEYAEAYAMEPIAKKMLAEDPQLKSEFEEKLKDPAFANNPGARLNFFFERSKWFDQRYRICPVYRLTSEELKTLSN
ncbi:MAG: hypothetical protein KF824_11245 [Fimbriimonadaceae bacterium]|nr:MAG: hypothetical protein KF824_11245 [Fimbriimonadaceae bacterium]